MEGSHVNSVTNMVYDMINKHNIVIPENSLYVVSVHWKDALIENEEGDEDNIPISQLARSSLGLMDDQPFVVYINSQSIHLVFKAGQDRSHNELCSKYTCIFSDTLKREVMTIVAGFQRRIEVVAYIAVQTMKFYGDVYTTVKSGESPEYELWRQPTLYVNIDCFREVEEELGDDIDDLEKYGGLYKYSIKDDTIVIKTRTPGVDTESIKRFIFGD